MTTSRTQSREALPANLARVNEAARRDPAARFTALLHHVNEESLERSFRRIRKSAASGVDGVTKEAYEANLAENLASLRSRVHRGSYRPQPALRVTIPKADGGERPLGIPALEDKIVQGAVYEVLSAIYEEDFLDFSYGFRRGLCAHDALEALSHGMRTQRVNWVLDADIRQFFDSVDHELLMTCVEHRIGDPRVLRLLRQWLEAGVLDDGVLRLDEAGTPQGSVISPLLANIYLHYALDVWFEKWRKDARGRVFLVRYADDFVMCFQYRSDANRMLADLQERMARSRLQLHEKKTRLIEFGRFAPERRQRRGEGKPETFDFLGFTHYMGKTRRGDYTMKRKTQSKRLSRKLKSVRREMRRRMHLPLPEQHGWLSSILRGHYRYFGVRCNLRSLQTFWRGIRAWWRRMLSRRSRAGYVTWEAFEKLLLRFPLPRPKLLAPQRPAPSYLG